jgi:hypothetical protein
MTQILGLLVFALVVIAGVVYDIDCTREGRPWW